MAKASSNGNATAMFLKTAMILSLFLAITMIQGRSTIGRIGFQKTNSVIVCNTVTGVASGDTCAAIAQKFKLSPDFFALINPNLNCNKLFVDQWLCVDGSAT